MRDPDWDTLAYVDANPDVLDRIAAHGVPRERLFSNPDDAFDRVKTDAVTVSVPNPWRVPVLHRALDEGRHILVDKPLVHTAPELRALLERGAKRTSVFMVAQNYRLFLGPHVARQWLEGGRFGPVGSIHVRFLRRSPMGQTGFLRNLTGATPLAVEMLIHQFDLLRYFLKTDPLTVKAGGWRNVWSLGAGFDALNVNMEFPDGVHAVLDADWGSAYTATDWPGDWVISMRDGAISLGDPGRSWRAYDATGSIVTSDSGPEEVVDTAQSMDGVWRKFKGAIVSVEAGERTPGQTYCSLEDNARSLGIALAVCASAESGETVSYPSFLEAHHIASPVQGRSVQHSSKENQ